MQLKEISDETADQSAKLKLYGVSGIDEGMKAVRLAAKGANVFIGRDLTDMSESAVKKWVNSGGDTH